MTKAIELKVAAKTYHRVASSQLSSSLRFGGSFPLSSPTQLSSIAKMEATTLRNAVRKYDVTESRGTRTQERKRNRHTFTDRKHEKKAAATYEILGVVAWQVFTKGQQHWPTPFSLKNLIWKFDNAIWLSEPLARNSTDTGEWTHPGVSEGA